MTGPIYEFTCRCSKKCHTSIDAVKVNAFRQDIWSGNYSTTVIKEMILEARTTRFDGCCMSTLVHVAACSNQFLYHKPNSVTTDTNTSRSRADIAIMAWFEELLPITDKMPDTNWYLLSAGNCVGFIRTLYLCKC